ncbi:MAG: AMP-binding protein [Lachnospiraceae bacterium]|nr:AMP-binding protein [Lachnospiraceae bacterium]
MLFYKEIEKYGDASALITEKGTVISYQELVARADQIGKAAGQRCLVFSICKNVEESVIGYVGFLRNDIVPVLLSPDIHAELLADLLNSYHPSYVWAPAGQAGIAGTVIYRDGNYELYRTGMVVDYSLDSELALLLTTSGSTGSPKLVRQSWNNIQSNTESIVEYLGIAQTDRAITTLPMNYTYGLSIINSHLCQGATIILTEATLLDKTFWALLKSQKATTFGGVPYTYEMLKKLRFERMDVPSLRYITQAGGKLVKEMAEEFNQICLKKDMQLIIMYGQTEATARMAYLPWKDAQRKAGSIGIAIPGGELSLIDTEGNGIDEPEVVGEMLYRGANVTLGYAESRHDLNKPDENKGVLHTGDMAKRDKDGFYYVVGRKKRFLKLFGNRVNLDELENLLKKEGIENACTGQDDHLKIYITHMEQEKETIDYLVSHTAISRGGFEVRHIAEIPRNESGKILYSALEGK